jgi:glutathione peroxidase
MTIAYDFSFRNKNGEELPLSTFRGRVLLIVNTASQCGFTKQYKDLQILYQTYHERGLEILAIPSNDFGKQEPGSDEEIQTFCQVNFGVTFPVAKKEIVKGDNAHPFYIWAKKTLGFGTAPKWNFHKYFINRDGVLVDYFNSLTSPSSKKVIKIVEKYLEQQTTMNL